MTTRNRPIVRTPRRRKLWATVNTNQGILATPDHLDLLLPAEAVLGMKFNGVTVMRIVGSIILVQLAQAASAVYTHLDMGFTWEPADTAALAPGVAGIPQPWNQGLRDQSWIQQGSVEGPEDQTQLFLNEPRPATPPEANRWIFDIEQMRKQPTAGHRLMLVWDDKFDNTESNVQGLLITLSVMLALP